MGTRLFKSGHGTPPPPFLMPILLHLIKQSVFGFHIAIKKSYCGFCENYIKTQVILFRWLDLINKKTFNIYCIHFINIKVNKVDINQILKDNKKDLPVVAQGHKV